MKKIELEESTSKKTNKIIIIICLIVAITLGTIVFLMMKNAYNNINNPDNIFTNDVKTYKVGNLYFDNLNNHFDEEVKTTSAKYYDFDNINANIIIENNNIYLTYEKDGIKQQKRINIDDEKAKHVVVILSNVIRYVYILTENGNVYLNSEQLSSSNIDAFIKFSKIENLSNVSKMVKYGGTLYFLINDQLYDKYGEIIYNDTMIKADPENLQTGTVNYYYMQVDNDGLLYKKIINKTVVIGSPENTSSILTHQKQENELFEDSKGENIIVSILFGIDNDIYLVDSNGNYYKLEVLDNMEIKLNVVNSKKVTSVDKYLKSYIVEKIDINYADGTKDIYSRDTNESIW